MVTINSSHMGLQFMDALMGKLVFGIDHYYAMLVTLHRFSHKIIWLELLTTNNDPNVVLVSYLLAVLQNNVNGLHYSFIRYVHITGCYVCLKDGPV